jgi:RNA polymerase sigma factor (sigma-70 family)
MYIKYRRINPHTGKYETVEIDVSPEVNSVLVETQRDIWRTDKVSRRHNASLESMLYEGALFADIERPQYIVKRRSMKADNGDADDIKVGVDNDQPLIFNEASEIPDCISLITSEADVPFKDESMLQVVHRQINCTTSFMTSAIEDEFIERTEVNPHVWEAFSYLTQKQQRVLYLNAIEGLSIRDIAKHLSLSKSTVSECLEAAKKNMKKFI